MNLHRFFWKTRTFHKLLLTPARETAIFVIDVLQILINLEDISDCKNNETRSRNCMTPSKFALAAIWKCEFRSVDKCSG